MTTKTILLEQAAISRGAKVIAVPPLEQLGDGSPTERLLIWLTTEHGFHRLDNVFTGDKLFKRLNDAETIFREGKANAKFAINVHFGLLEIFEGSRLIGDGLFIGVHAP